ncbi:MULTISPECIES: hypothetical protein [Bacillaceae]|uniref:Uncharacterized protein n=1 Tax=Evansella alkalicola TaxID=745819 RepID=A0ABS6JVL5_9BACI|nr:MULTISPECIES: hypothetical protein [Bacillaceae]MBU9722634.1 hypothetical protein [Bacillus alkalicola]
MFNPVETFSLGPFTVSFEMLFMIVSIGVGYGGMIIYLKRNQIPEREKILDAFITSVIIGVLTYKLWPFILQPSLLLDPSNFIYYMGGPYAFFAAATFSIAYYLFQALRKKWSHYAYDGFTFTIVLASAVFYLFVKEFGVASPFALGFYVDGIVHHPVNLYRSWLYFLVLLTCLGIVPNSKKYGRTFVLIIGVIISVYLVSPFTV